MQAQELTIADYAGMLRRRWRPAGAVALLIALGSVYLAYTLPAVYESSATIMIEQQEIPDEVVQSLVGGHVDERIQSIRQRVLVAERVEAIIRESDLYPAERGVVPMSELVDRFRASAGVEPFNVPIVHQRTGRPNPTTYAFRIYFHYHHPEKTRDVARELSRLWLAENEGLRREAATRTTRFLETEAARLEASMSEIQEKLADLKERHAESLPESRLINLQTYERLDRELAEVDGRLRDARERQSLLETELAETPRFRPMVGDSGDPVLGGADRLAQLQQELIAARGRYSENHPDVVRLRREIAALSNDPQNRASLEQQVRTSLESSRAELASARQSLSDNHPEVLRLQRTVDSLEEQLRGLQAAGGSASARPAPNNPPYLQLQARLQSVETELQDLGRRRASLAARLRDIESRIAIAPQVEREYASLNREYDLLLRQYQDMRGLHGQAGLAEVLETDYQGERLTILEPPALPSEPIKPNRLSMSFLGVILAIAIGLGVVSLTESMDTTVRGRRDVKGLLDMPPLGVIPRIETAADRGKRILVNLVTGAVVISAVAFVIRTVF
jgi:polysaccharide biosynthesis transport protein